jgi:hypothetical protein
MGMQEKFELSSQKEGNRTVHTSPVTTQHRCMKFKIRKNACHKGIFHSGKQKDVCHNGLPGRFNTGIAAQFRIATE